MRASGPKKTLVQQTDRQKPTMSLENWSQTDESSIFFRAVHVRFPIPAVWERTSLRTQLFQQKTPYTLMPCVNQQASDVAQSTTSRLLRCRTRQHRCRSYALATREYLRRYFHEARSKPPYHCRRSTLHLSTSSDQTTHDEYSDSAGWGGPNKQSDQLYPTR